MLSTFAAYLTSVAFCCVIAVWAGRRFGKESAMGIGLAASLLVPTWFEIQFAGVPVNVQTTMTAFLLLAFSIHSGRKIWSPITIVDLLIGSLAVWQVAVDSYHGRGWLTPLFAYGEWMIPYFAGRYAVMHRGAICQLAPWFTGAVVIIATFSVFEAFKETNIWDAVISPIDDRTAQPRGFRYDLLHRAQGPTRHPIFLGVTLLLMLPWGIAWINETTKVRLRLVRGAISLLPFVLGVIATVSRGPLLGLAAIPVFLAAVRYRLVRVVLPLGLVAAGVVGVTQWERLVAMIDDTESLSHRRTVVVLDGKPEIYSGTRHRLLIFRVYWPLILKSGLFGYGSERISQFPPDIHGLPSNLETRQTLAVVDNSYLHLGLRLGLVGLAIYVASFAVAIRESLRLQRNAETYFGLNSSAFFTVSAASLVSVALISLTFYRDHEFAIWITFQMGVIGGLASYRQILLRNAFV